MGRKLLEWDEKDIEDFKKLCGLFATQEEVCSWFGGIDHKTLNRLINTYLKDDIAPGLAKSKKVSFADAIERYSVDAKISLRRKQLALAEEGDWRAVEWCSTHYLGQAKKKTVEKQVTVEKKATKEATPIDKLISRAADLGGMPAED